MNSDYKELAAQKGLPAIEELKSEIDIDEESSAVADVLHSLRDRIGSFCKIAEEILQPETSPATMQECRVFTEQDKKELYRLYSELMVLDRKLLYGDVTRNTDFIAKAIGEVWEKLPSLKERTAKIVNKMLESWSLDHGDENYAEYFG
ncbi:hypothetical protein D6764_02395 [Candidatus Woesearchaeota archaeon]|nr:MAG: hypothetical protein D6764_02395 [Candidatus Woesearchaeota archaeon]